MLAALDRHLKERDYMYSITRDRVFYQSKLVLEGKVKYLPQQRKGKRPNACTAKEKKYYGEQKLSAIPVHELFMRRCSGKQLRAANV